MPRLGVSELQKQALWLIGVLMALVIREAIVNSHAVFLSRGEPGSLLMGLLRLITFSAVSLRFYLGAVQYFNTAFELAPVNDLRSQRIGSDLVLGLIHFVFVCFWGLSIALLDRRWLVFPGLLLAILLCDVFWYARAVTDTRRSIRIRTLVNTITAGSAAIAFGETAFAFMCFANGWRIELTPFQSVICEAVAYVPAIMASVVELRRLVDGRAGVEEWLAAALPRSRPEARAG